MWKRVKVSYLYSSIVGPDIEKGENFIFVFKYCESGCKQLHTDRSEADFQVLSI